MICLCCLLLAAGPATAGTSVGGGTSMIPAHFLQLLLKKLGFSSKEAESCRPTEEQLDRYRAARTGLLPGVGRHEDSSDPCTLAISHALELEGLTGKGELVARAGPKQHAGTIGGAEPETGPATGTRPAN